MRRVCLFLVGVFLLSVSCSGKQLVDPDWMEKAGVKVLRLRWVKKLSPSMRNFLIPELMEEHDGFNPVEQATAGYDTDRKRAFVGTSACGLYCLDMKSGETVWRFELDDAIGSSPIYDSDRKTVYFGADDGVFYALHARSGRKLWATDVGAEVRRKAVIYEDTLYLANADNTVMALDPANGEIIWQYRRPPVEGFSSAGYAGLTLHESMLYTGFSDGFVAAIDPSAGGAVWYHDLAGEVTAKVGDGVVRLIDVDATPVVVDEVLVAASVAGGLQGLKAGTGTVLWTRPDLTGVTGLAEHRGIVYAARSAFGLVALNPKDGKTLWSRHFEAGTLQDPIVYDDVMLISDSEFGLFIASTVDGRLLQQIDQREGFFARPSVKNGYMLIIGNDGVLYALSIL